MVLFRTRNGSIPRFIYGTPKLFYIEPFFLVKGSIGQVLNPRVLYRTQRNPLFLRVWGSKKKNKKCKQIENKSKST